MEERDDSCKRVLHEQLVAAFLLFTKLLQHGPLIKMNFVYKRRLCQIRYTVAKTPGFKEMQQTKNVTWNLIFRHI